MAKFKVVIEIDHPYLHKDGYPTLSDVVECTEYKDDDRQNSYSAVLVDVEEVEESENK